MKQSETRTIMIYFKILAWIFAICLTSFGHGDEDSLREQKERKAKSAQLLAIVTNSQNEADLERALGVLHAAIDKNKTANVKMIDELRIQVYADTFLKLKNDNSLTSSVRIALWEILAEGTVNDNNDYAKNRCIEFIWRLMETRKKDHYSKHFVSCLEKGYKESCFYDWRYIVLALDASKSKLTMEIVKNYSNRIPRNTYRIYYSREWCATLIAARHNDKKSIKSLIKLCEAAREEERFYLLFVDISLVHDKMIVDYLLQYLKSDENMFDNSPCMHVEKIASRTALMLSRMLKDFPEYKDYNDMEAIEACRRWMEENKDYKFK